MPITNTTEIPLTNTIDVPCQISINGTATFQGFDCGPTTSIDEAGVFTSLVGGEMFARNTFNDVDLEASDQLTLNWDFVFTDS